MTISKYSNKQEEYNSIVPNEWYHDASEEEFFYANEKLPSVLPLPIYLFPRLLKRKEFFFINEIGYGGYVFQILIPSCMIFLLILAFHGIIPLLIIIPLIVLLWIFPIPTGDKKLFILEETHSVDRDVIKLETISRHGKVSKHKTITYNPRKKYEELFDSIADAGKIETNEQNKAKKIITSLADIEYLPHRRKFN